MDLEPSSTALMLSHIYTHKKVRNCHGTLRTLVSETLRHAERPQNHTHTEDGMSTPPPVHAAIHRGASPHEVIELMERGESPNCAFEGITPLERAVLRRRADLVAPLVSMGACVNPLGESYLLMAVMGRDVDTVTALLRAGAKVTEAPNGRSLLLVAMDKADSASSKLVHALLQAGMDPRDGGSRGAMPILKAASMSNTAVAIDNVKELLKMGARADDSGKRGLTSLMTCSRAEVARALVDAGADPAARCSLGLTCLDYAAIRGESVAYLEALISLGADPSNGRAACLALARGFGAQAAFLKYTASMCERSTNPARRALARHQVASV